MAQNYSGNTRAFRTSPSWGAPAPAWVAGAAPPSPGHIQRLWSLGPCRAAPPALGTSESPPKPRIRSPHSAPIPNPAWLTRFPLPPILQQPGAASSPSDLLLPARPSHLTSSPASAGISLAPILENLIFLNQSSFIWIHWSNNYSYSPFSCICGPTEHRNWVRSPEPFFWGKSEKKKKKRSFEERSINITISEIYKMGGTAIMNPIFILAK